eukprot:tig00000248_g21800.t1
MGLRADFAEDGAEAVERWAAGRHRCVLLDLNMPRMGGVEACERILALAGAGPRPFVAAVTADVDAAVRDRCRRAGIEGVLVKPFRVEEFRSMVSGALQQLPQLPRLQQA